MLLAIRCLVLPSVLLVAAADPLSTQLADLLGKVSSAFEKNWHHVRRSEPLVPIGLEDVEQWLALSNDIVAPEDIELFAAPPVDQAGTGGDFDSDPRPVGGRYRLQHLRREFGCGGSATALPELCPWSRKGGSLVINSLHRWCPKAARLAADLKAKVTSHETL